MSAAGPQISITQPFPAILAAPGAQESAPSQLENAAPSGNSQRKSGFALQGQNQTQNEKLLPFPDFLTLFSPLNSG